MKINMFRVRCPNYFWGPSEDTEQKTPRGALHTRWKLKWKSIFFALGFQATSGGLRIGSGRSVGSVVRSVGRSVDRAVGRSVGRSVAVDGLAGRAPPKPRAQGACPLTHPPELRGHAPSLLPPPELRGAPPHSNCFVFVTFCLFVVFCFIFSPIVKARTIPSYTW
jgi:hypothetical protein